MKICSMTLLLLFGFITASPAAVIHVPGDQPTIQAGIDAAAEGDTVLVADGLYRGPGNRDLNFRGKAITVQSAGGPLRCTIDAEGSLDFPRRCVIFSHWEGQDSVLRGFTLTGGFNSVMGGGIYITPYASPTITGNIITGNTATRGSGIGCDRGGPWITGNIISNNGYSSVSNGGGIYGVQSSAVVSDNLFLENITNGPGGGASFINSWPRIENNRFVGNHSSGDGGTHNGGGLACSSLTGSTLIRNNIFRENSADQGGAICCVDADPRIIGNVFKDNMATNRGGAIYCTHSSPLIESCRFSGNHATWGAGINCNTTNAQVSNCLLVENRAGYSGGGITCTTSSEPVIRGCTFVLNEAVISHGGAISAHSGSSLEVLDCIFWDNDAPLGPQIGVGHETSATTLTISYSDVQGGQADTLVDPASTLNWGAGMIDADPCFAQGALGGYFLCQIAAGQSVDSPCVDAGDPAGTPLPGSTRTDFVADSDLADMGYHWATTGRLVAGPGPGRNNPPQVRLFMPAEDAEPLSSFSAYGVPRYGVNLACGDLFGDGDDEIITGAGPGAVFGPHVRGFKPNGTPLPGVSFLAYGTNRWGVKVTCGDLNGDGDDEIITGAGPGAVFGPHVRAWDMDGFTAVAIPGVSFMAYGTNKWGVNVACGDIDGDGCDEIITGAGPGAVFGPHVRAWNVDGLTAAAIPGVSFFAYNTHSWGVNVACGDVNGDGLDELLTAPGPSQQFGAHVRGWTFDGSTVSPMPDVDFMPWSQQTAAYGAMLHGGPDLNQDGREEIFIGSGPDPDAASQVSVFRHDGSELIRWFGLSPFEEMTDGANVAAGWME